MQRTVSTLKVATPILSTGVNFGYNGCKTREKAQASKEKVA
jgi:hypothetical protein